MVVTVSRPSKNPAQVDVLYDLVSWDWFKVNVWLDFTAPQHAAKDNDAI